MNDIIRAKELFFSYDGLFFHMDREGDYDEYKKFKITKEIENKWLIEISEKYIKLIIDFTKAPEGIEQYSYCLNEKIAGSTISTAIISLQEAYTAYCTFGKIRASESLLDLLNKITNKSLKLQIINLAKEISDSIEKPYKISSYYRKNRYLADCLTNEKLEERVSDISNNILKTKI